MKANLLLISSRNTAESLAQDLEAQGYFCFQARGPLKMRTLLTQQPVDLVIWWESLDNSGLDEDLAQVWRKFPAVPVVALLQGQAAVSQVMRANTFAAVVPGDDVERLLQTLQRLHGDARGAALDPPAGAGELAFRQVLHPEPAGETPGVSKGLIEASGTSVNAAERSILRTGVPLPDENAGLSWWKRLRGRQTPRKA